MALLANESSGPLAAVSALTVAEGAQAKVESKVEIAAKVQAGSKVEQKAEAKVEAKA